MAKHIRYFTCSGTIKIEGYPFFATGFVVVGMCYVVPDCVFYFVLYSCIQFYDCFVRVSKHLSYSKTEWIV